MTIWNQNVERKLSFFYTYTDSFIVHIKAENIYAELAEDVETRYDTSNFEVDRELLKSKYKKANWADQR